MLRWNMHTGTLLGTLWPGGHEDSVPIAREHLADVMVA